MLFFSILSKICAHTCVWDVNRQFFLSSVWYLRISASSAVHTKYLFLPIFGPFSRTAKENCQIEKINSKFDHKFTANPNPVKLTGNPCKSIPTGKNLYSLQGTPVFIAGSLFSLQGFPCISLYFPVRDCSVEVVARGNYDITWPLPCVTNLKKSKKLFLRSAYCVAMLILLEKWLLFFYSPMWPPLKKNVAYLGMKSGLWQIRPRHINTWNKFENKN